MRIVPNGLAALSKRFIGDLRDRRLAGNTVPLAVSPLRAVRQCRAGCGPLGWLPGRDSNPDRQIQSLLSYH